MTVGHLLFALGGTAYLAIGSLFEERDRVPAVILSISADANST